MTLIFQPPTCSRATEGPLSLVHTGDNIECRSDLRQKSILLSRSNELARKSTEPATTLLPVR